MWEGPGLEGVGGARVGGCGRGQGWRVWEGTGLEGVGGDRVGGCAWKGSGMEIVGGGRDGGCGRVCLLFTKQLTSHTSYFMSVHYLPEYILL